MPRGKKSTKDKSRKKRGPNRVHQCFSCPKGHEGWPKYKLHWRSGTPYCQEHFEEYVQKQPKQWPNCPLCGEELGTIRWGGSVEKSTIDCESVECEFIDKAVNHVDYYAVYVIAAPLV